jgi:hypothetical protein
VRHAGGLLLATHSPGGGLTVQEQLALVQLCHEASQLRRRFLALAIRGGSAWWDGVLLQHALRGVARLLTGLPEVLDATCGVLMALGTASTGSPGALADNQEVQQAFCGACCEAMATVLNLAHMAWAAEAAPYVGDAWQPAACRAAAVSELWTTRAVLRFMAAVPAALLRQLPCQPSRQPALPTALCARDRRRLRCLHLPHAAAATLEAVASAALPSPNAGPSGSGATTLPPPDGLLASLALHCLRLPRTSRPHAACVLWPAFDPAAAIVLHQGWKADARMYQGSGSELLEANLSLNAPSTALLQVLLTQRALPWLSLVGPDQLLEGALERMPPLMGTLLQPGEGAEPAPKTAALALFRR